MLQVTYSVPLGRVLHAVPFFLLISLVACSQTVTFGSMGTNALLSLGTFLLAAAVPAAVGVLRSAISGK